LSIRPLPGEAEGVEASAIPEDRMNMHKNARLTPRGRERIAELVANTIFALNAVAFEVEGLPRPRFRR
jgi:hypothetical protein